MKKIGISFVCLFAFACSDAEPGKGVSNNSNNQSAQKTNNKSVASNNTTRSNNATSSNNQSTRGTNNKTAQSNNQTGQTNKGTTSQTTGSCKDLSPSLGECDPLCQSGCEMTEHCITTRPTAKDDVVSKCETRGTKGQDQQCDKNGDCGVGFGCRNFRGDKACRQYCDPSGKNEPTCQEDFACIPIGGERRVGICVKIEHKCTTLNDLCAEGEECYDFQSGRRCTKAGDKKLGDVCTSSVACTEGLRCVSVSGKLKCRTICNPKAAANKCEKDTSCHTLNARSGEALDWGACF